MKLGRAWLLMAALPAFGQLIYNEQRDKQAQEAQKLAADLQNGRVFQKALDNLDVLWKQRQEGVFRNAEDQMVARLGVLETWAQVDEFMGILSLRLGVDQGPKLAAAVASLKRQEAKTQAALKVVKEKIAAIPNSLDVIGRLGNWFQEVGKVDQIVDFALSKSGAPAEQFAAAKEAEKQLKALADQYQAFAVSLPASPGVLFLQDQLEVLKVQEDHAQNLIAIEKRRQKELKAIRDLLEQTTAGLQCLTATERQGSIASTLEARAAKANAAAPGSADDVCLGTLTFALFNFTALTARSDTASRLAALRSSLEDRASALRLSAAGTRQIEELITNGVTRLAMFHKGGLKPETLAQLIQALATAGIIPAVVLK